MDAAARRAYQRKWYRKKMDSDPEFRLRKIYQNKANKEKPKSKSQKVRTDLELILPAGKNEGT